MTSMGVEVGHSKACMRCVQCVQRVLSTHLFCSHGGVGHSKACVQCVKSVALRCVYFAPMMLHAPYGGMALLSRVTVATLCCSLVASLMLCWCLVTWMGQLADILSTDPVTHHQGQSCLLLSVALQGCAGGRVGQLVGSSTLQSSAQEVATQNKELSHLSQTGV
jgi:predicted membrane metal-binding protein